MQSEKLLYQTVGERIRSVRERTIPKISQTQLAHQLNISRVSIVNIEAGRQHAPLFLLWRIAQELGTELVLLIPHSGEFGPPLEPTVLDQQTIDQIQQAADGDPQTRRQLTEFIGKVKARTTENSP